MCGCAGSRTFSTLSTAMGDSSEEYWDTTLLLRDLRGGAPAAIESHADSNQKPVSELVAKVQHLLQLEA